jgi:hypothetical protein
MSGCSDFNGVPFASIVCLFGWLDGSGVCGMKTLFLFPFHFLVLSLVSFINAPDR